MKNSILLLFAFCVSFSFFGQNRNGISYQALITSPVNDNGITISLPGVDRKIISYRDRDVCLQFSFLDSNGNTEYVETQQTTTDSYGMVNLVIGTGTPDAGYSWDNITWTAESKSLKVDVDYGTRGNVSCDNFVGLSVQELTAVPFALYAPSVEGAPGPEGPEGPKGDKGDQGQQGPKGDKGDTGDQGPQGIQGPAGADGDTGPAGPTGPQGADSTVPGPQGATGPQGPKGDKGDTGDQGPQGIQGPAGATGPAGPTGPQGADSTVPGPAGPAGATGPTGPQGPKGDKGDTGDQGPQGETGPAGPQGDTGDQGSQGEVGPVGPRGIQGIQGPQGATGPAGPTGPAGADGAVGAQGIQGPQGETGPAGPQGNDGADGNGIVSATDNGDGTFTLLFDNGTTFTTDDLTGPQGAAGATGSAGAQGIQGPQGATGPAGPTGPAGADGADGADGAQGIQGIQGPQGATGGDGPQGIAGNDGADGDSAYDIWLSLGNTGTQQDFIDSLTGPQGPQGETGESSSSIGSVPLLTSNEINNLNPSFGDMVFDTESLTLKIYLQLPYSGLPTPQKLDLPGTRTYEYNQHYGDKYYYSGQITNDCYITWAGSWGDDPGRIYKDTDSNLGNGKGNEVPFGTKFFAGEYVHFEVYTGRIKFWQNTTPSENTFSDGQFINLIVEPKKFWKVRQDYGYPEDQWYVDGDWWELYVDFKLDVEEWKTIIDYDY